MCTAQPGSVGRKPRPDAGQQTFEQVISCRVAVGNGKNTSTLLLRALLFRFLFPVTTPFPYKSHTSMRIGIDQDN